MCSEAFKHVCMFKIPLPVMENAQPRLSKTIDNCFSLNHVCMFEKSPKPHLPVMLFAIRTQRKPANAIIFFDFQKDTGRDTILILVYIHTYIHTYPVFARRINTL